VKGASAQTSGPLAGFGHRAAEPSELEGKGSDFEEDFSLVKPIAGKPDAGHH
jgi:hypothetical protein